MSAEESAFRAQSEESIEVEEDGGVKDGSIFDANQAKAATTTSSRHGDMLLPPTMTKQGLECSIHRCPKALKRELERIFPDTEIGEDFLAIPTAQHAKMDLVRIGQEVENEKDALLETVSRVPGSLPCSPLPAACALLQFMDFAKPVCDELISQGYWADYIDPCSGLPVSV